MEPMLHLLMESIIILVLGVHIILLLIAHFVGDFLCQPRVMALNKTKSLYYLSLHGLLVGVPVFLVFFMFKPVLLALSLTVIYVIVHCAQDFFVWTIAIRLFGESEKYWEEKKFYDIIGFDQFLHVAFLVFLATFGG